MQFAGYQPDAYGAQSAAQMGGAPYGTTQLSWKPRQRRRMNVLAICLNVFVPWLIFCGIFAMLSFDMHYRKPATCRSLVIVTIVLLVLLGAMDVMYMLWKRRRGDGGYASTSWVLFLVVCSLFGTAVAVSIGSRNYWENSGLYYDVVAMNTYTQVDPSRMRGQEIMDAGLVTFANGTHLDLTKSMGFKNSHTYCVAPITGGAVVGNPPLAHYDFWAVGKGCCSGSASGGDFTCGAYDNPGARAGVRLVSDDDRDFYRLAVQQAQSAYQIKATHPLFFHWVADAKAAAEDYQRRAFKAFVAGMFAFFAFQLTLVYVAVSCFSKLLGS